MAFVSRFSLGVLFQSKQFYYFKSLKKRDMCLIQIRFRQLSKCYYSQFARKKDVQMH